MGVIGLGPTIFLPMTSAYQISRVSKLLSEFLGTVLDSFGPKAGQNEIGFRCLTL